MAKRLGQRSWLLVGFSKAQSGHSSDYQDEATIQAEHFLPDFVIAWMLLQRSGLDQHEKGAVIANLKNEFTTKKKTFFV